MYNSHIVTRKPRKNPGCQKIINFENYWFSLLGGMKRPRTFLLEVVDPVVARHFKTRKGGGRRENVGDGGRKENLGDVG